MEIVDRTTSPDGSIKYALKTTSNGLIEAVYYKFAGYNVESRPLLDVYKFNGKYPEYGICISTQVGCEMGCTFCATGYGGFFSNLKEDELISQLNLIHDDIMTRGIEQPDAIGNVVTMGMGEPLMNYMNLIRFCQQIYSEKGKRFIPLVSVSTIGILPNIQKLATEQDISVKLYFSIHSPFED